MKKIITVGLPAILMILFTMQYVSANDRITQDLSELPSQAKAFISQHFKDKKVSHLKIDNDLFESKKYEVIFTDGTDLEFDSKGNWIEIDCKRNVVPSAIIPQEIRAYFKANFPNQNITQIERGRQGYDVELANDLDIKFDKNGVFKRLDD